MVCHVLVGARCVQHWEGKVFIMYLLEFEFVLWLLEHIHARTNFCSIAYFDLRYK